MSARAAALLAATLLLQGPSFAQQRQPNQAPAAPPPLAEPPPYEPQLLRLAEILGSLAYLRDLCGAKDGDAWRQRMANLLEAEGATQARRERLAGAFNRGFRGYETTYRACTPNAELVISRYIEEGGRITRDVSSRFGGG